MISVKNAYDRICETWDDARRKRPVDKCIVDYADKLKKGSHILDVGCGSGYPIAEYFSYRGFVVRGIDISENMIKKAKSLNLANAAFEVCDFLDFVSEEKYDAVVAFDSLFHVEYSRQKYVFKKAAELLKSGGLFLFTYGKKDGEIAGEMFGEKFYYSSLDFEETKDCLVKNGFEIVEFTLDYKEKTTGTRDLLSVARKL